ncbi:hypothetical protein H4R35_007168 [Dimargaris xerosporica]|nr:hypothetical protein H4R35_007168 [Dimargaris xerosporica]
MDNSASLQASKPDHDNVVTKPTIAPSTHDESTPRAQPGPFVDNAHPTSLTPPPPSHPTSSSSTPGLTTPSELSGPAKPQDAKRDEGRSQDDLGARGPEAAGINMPKFAPNVVPGKLQPQPMIYQDPSNMNVLDAMNVADDAAATPTVSASTTNEDEHSKSQTYKSKISRTLTVHVKGTTAADDELLESSASGMMPWLPLAWVGLSIATVHWLD